MGGDKMTTIVRDLMVKGKRCEHDFFLQDNKYEEKN